ncbi:MAG TPA: hypothetical protein VFO93_17770 [Hymenobacter sp.]|uniref:DUF6934 family protein n=1 Tax=Hymenobacter sp. TaxID=1898978 RepID=UPI002D7FFDEB|nr:hypothetical protein [Hymenobacter sp.]HET9505397.1 hypothetical protein [Hymenobacter sp.]
MKLPKYQLKADEELSVYRFVSEGRKGLIPKRIQFTLINQEEIYNLAFGDEHPATGQLDNLAISDNGDSVKVLATVVAAVYAFFDQHPAAWVYLSGSTAARTRLYQMAIATHYAELTTDFAIYGEYQEEWQAFEKGKSYTAFIAHLHNKLS